MRRRGAGVAALGGEEGAAPVAACGGDEGPAPAATREGRRGHRRLPGQRVGPVSATAQEGRRGHCRPPTQHVQGRRVRHRPWCGEERRGRRRPRRVKGGGGSTGCRCSEEGRLQPRHGREEGVMPAMVRVGEE
jgi:hypothetical protein